MRRFAAAISLTVMALAIPTPSRAAGDGAICDSVAYRAAEHTGVPVYVLRAITRTETGRASKTGVAPWPWTVNMEGKGVWFDTPAEAQTYVARHVARGARSFDVGCFQLNYRWHGDAFASVEDMFDPLENALYAARFLKELHTEFGNWTDAAGAYHSRTPEYAERYKTRFRDFVDLLEAAPDLPPVRLAVAQSPETPTKPPAPNLYPFLKPASEQTRMGSLVPGIGGGGAFIALPGAKG